MLKPSSKSVPARVVFLYSPLLEELRCRLRLVLLQDLPFRSSTWIPSTVSTDADEATEFGSTRAVGLCGCLLEILSLLDEPLPRNVLIECLLRPPAADPAAGRVDERL